MLEIYGIIGEQEWIKRRILMMKCVDIKIKSYICVYWAIWLIITLLILCLKYIYFMGQRNLFELVIIYVLILWSPMMFLNLYEEHRLLKYIEIIYPQESDKIKNSFGIVTKKSLLLFVNENSLDNSMLKQLYGNYKKFVMFMYFVFFSLPFISLIILN